MAQAGPAIAIGVIGLALSAYQISQQMDAAEEAEDIGLANQAAIEAEAGEEVRRERYNLDKEKSLLRARIAASGISGVSSKAYYTDYVTERENEILWLKTSAEARGEIAKKQGERASDIGKAQALSTVASTAYQSYDWYSTYVA